MAEICRLCGDLQSIDLLIPIDDPNHSIKTKLKCCCQLEFTDPDFHLPQNVCHKCLDQLNTNWKFAENLKMVQNTFKKVFDQKEPNNRKKQKFEIIVDLSLKLQCMKLHLEGNSIEKICKILKIKPNTVKEWVKGYKLSENENFTESESNQETTNSIISASSSIANIVEISSDEDGNLLVEMDEDVSMSSNNSECTKLLEDENEDEDDNDNDLFVKPSESRSKQDSNDEQWKDVRCMCTACNKYLLGVTELRKHVLEKHKERIEDALYGCAMCSKSFRVFGTFIFHVHNIHKRHLKFSCYICNRNMKQRLKLIKHIKLHNFNEFICDKCPSVFLNLSSLNKHKYTHKKIETFSCKICSATYQNQDSLDRHAHIHKETIFKCNFCAAMFDQEHLCKQHESTHNITAEFVCNICSNKYSERRKLTNHMRCHKPKHIKCDLCEYKTNSNYILKMHQKCHLSQKSWPCTKCEQKYQSSSELKTHSEKWHNDLHIYTCCGNIFSNYTAYESHKQSAHGSNLKSN